MRSYFLIALLFLVGTIGFAQSAAEQEVWQVEKDRFAAQVAKNYDLLEKVIGDDLYYIHSNGNVDTKSSFIGGMRDGSRQYGGITMDETKVRVFHNKTAVINGICTYLRTGENDTSNNLRLRYTSVYVKRGKQWQMVSWQSFRMP
jgi:uncharacterized protein (TIGR02246 family)